MSLNSYVSIDIRQAANALGNLRTVWQGVSSSLNVKVTIEGATEATTTLKELQTTLTKVKSLTNSTLKVKVDVANVDTKINSTIGKLQQLQTAARAMNGGQNKINIQATVTEALDSLRQVLAVVRDLKDQSTIIINVQMKGDAVAAIEDVHKRLAQLNGSGVQWSDTAQKMGGETKTLGVHFGSLYSKIVMAGRAIASMAVIVRTLQSAYNAVFGFSNLLAQTNVGLTTLFDGNQKKADKLLNTLKQYAIPTPFAMADLAPLTQQAIAFGLIDKNSKTLNKDLTSLFDDVGNAAYGLGKGQEGINRIMLAFGQMHTAGRVMGQDMLQLQSIGVNAWKYLAEATGKSTAEVRKMVEQGLIPADAAIKVIREGIREDFWGGMINGAKTLEGAISQIQDSIKVLTAGKLSSIYQDITKDAQNIVAALGTPEGQKAVGEAIDKVVEILTSLGHIIVWLAGVINDKWQYIVAGLTIIGSVQMVTGIKATVAALGSLSVPILIAAAAVVAFIAAYRNIKEVRTFTRAVIGDTIGFLRDFSYAIYKVFDLITNAIRTTIGWFQKIPNAIIPFLGPGGAAVQAMKALGSNLTDALNFKGIAESNDKFWADLAKGWDKKGSKTFENLLTGSITGNLGIDKIVADINKEIAKIKPVVPGQKPSGPKPGELPLGAGDADTKRVKKNLEDAAKYWDNYAKAVESSADRQISALKGVADSITSLVDSLKNDLIKNGVLNDPLQPAVAKLMRDLNLHGQAQNIAIGAAQRIQLASAQAAQYRSQADALGGSGAATSGAANASQTTAALIKQIGDSVQSGAPAASCAYTASKILQAIGVKVPTVSGAKALRDKVLAMGAVQIPFSQAQAGDLVVQSGKNYGAAKFGGVGYHTTIAEGNGNVFSSSGRRTQEYHPVNGNPVAYTFRGAGSAAQTATGGMAAAQNLQQVVQSLLDKAATVAARGSKVYAVPKEWLALGGAVKDTPGNEARYKFQQFLTTQEGHDLFTSKAAQTKGGAAAVAKTLRSDVNQLDYANNAANIKTATDATAKFVEEKRQEILTMRDGTKWLQNNTYNSLEYKKAMDIAKAAAQAKIDVDKSGIPISERAAQVAARVKIATQAINDALRSSAFTDHIKRVADLDNQYAALNDTTIQQIATRKVLSREDAAQLTTAEKNLEIQKEIRNAQASYLNDQVSNATSQIIKMQADLKAKMGNYNPGQQLQAQFDTNDQLRRIQDPTWKADWELTQKRAQEIALAIKSWDFDTQKKKLEDFNSALADTSLSAKKAQQLIAQNVIDAAKANNPGALFDSDQMQKLLSAGSSNDLGAIKDKITDFTRSYNEQIAELQNGGHAINQAQRNISAFRDALADAELTAQKNGVWDTVKNQFAGIAAALNQIDPQKLQQLQEAAKFNEEATRIQDETTLTKILNPIDAAFAQWKMNLAHNGMTEEDIERLVPAQLILQKAQEVRGYLDTMTQGISSTLNNAFTNLFEQGPKHFFRNILDGLTNMLNQMATQILTSYAMNALLGGMGSGGGGGGLLSGIISGIFGGGGGGGGGLGSLGAISFPSLQLATGMPTIPYDNFPAMLHKNEAVLTAQQAQDWRNQQREMSRIPSSGSSTRQAGSNVTIVQQYHIGQVVANNPQEFAGKLPGKQAVASSELQRALYLATKQGARRV
jgi:tape measure domain-containing protein